MNAVLFLSLIALFSTNPAAAQPELTPGNVAKGKDGGHGNIPRGVAKGFRPAAEPVRLPEETVKALQDFQTLVNLAEKIRVSEVRPLEPEDVKAYNALMVKAGGVEAKSISPGADRLLHRQLVKYYVSDPLSRQQRVHPALASEVAHKFTDETVTGQSALEKLTVLQALYAQSRQPGDSDHLDRALGRVIYFTTWATELLSRQAAHSIERRPSEADLDSARQRLQEVREITRMMELISIYSLHDRPATPTPP